MVTSQYICSQDVCNIEGSNRSENHMQWSKMIAVLPFANQWSVRLKTKSVRILVFVIWKRKKKKKRFCGVALYHIWNLLLKTPFTIYVSQKRMCLKFRSGNMVWKYRFHFHDRIFGFCYLYFSHKPFLYFFSHFPFLLLNITFSVFIIWVHIYCFCYLIFT